MEEKKTEKNVTWFVLIVIALKLLGFDVEQFLNTDLSNQVINGTESVVNNLQEIKENISMIISLVVTGSVYTGGRTIFKSIVQWRTKNDKENEN